jgi:erythromycin esterase
MKRWRRGSDASGRHAIPRRSYSRHGCDAKAGTRRVGRRGLRGADSLFQEQAAKPTVGSALRSHYGAEYVSVAIGFHHGDLGIATVPPPAPDWLDARLAAPGEPARLLDLREPDQRRRWDGPCTLRVISGAYDPARDAAEHLTVASLAEAYDLLIHLNEVSPVRSSATRQPS